ncbi:MAG: hypothetical protein LBK28_05635, partial [Propionibacteriaceae bacterium]|nr:hypothetical protein [Propionibacteriaceae bacterium]
MKKPTSVKPLRRGCLLAICLAFIMIGLPVNPGTANALAFDTPPFSSRLNTTFVYVEAAEAGGSLDVSGTFYTRSDGGSASAYARVTVVDPSGSVAWDFFEKMPDGSHSRKLPFVQLGLASAQAGVWMITSYGTDSAGTTPHGNGAIVGFNAVSCTEQDRDSSKPCAKPQPGRVWWENLALEQRAFTGVTGSNDPQDLTLWTLSPWGVQHEITQYGYQGISSNITVSNLGLVDGSCEPVYRSDNQLIGTAQIANSSVGECAEKFFSYRLFDTVPDPTMPESAAFNGGKTWVLPKYRNLTSSL